MTPTYTETLIELKTAIAELGGSNALLAERVATLAERQRETLALVKHLNGCVRETHEEVAVLTQRVDAHEADHDRDRSRSDKRDILAIVLGVLGGVGIDIAQFFQR